MLTASAVAHELGISPRSVYGLAESGLLVCYRLGVGRGAVRFDPADVEAYRLSITTPSRQLTTREARTLERLRALAAEVPDDAIPSMDSPIASPCAPRQKKKPISKSAQKLRKDARQVLVRHHAAKRRAERTTRTPPWANLAAIRALHAQAQMLTHKTGVAHHVDHVIPLQGARVSGLHVETNMQILTGAENSRKKNRFEIE